VLAEMNLEQQYYVTRSVLIVDFRKLDVVELVDVDARRLPLFCQRLLLR